MQKLHSCTDTASPKYAFCGGKRFSPFPLQHGAVSFLQLVICLRLHSPFVVNASQVCTIAQQTTFSAGLQNSGSASPVRPQSHSRRYTAFHSLRSGNHRERCFKPTIGSKNTPSATAPRTANKHTNFPLQPDNNAYFKHEFLS